MENELKLIKLSTKSWHYKLVLWFLGSKAPTPKNTFNFCRYFWILMFVVVVMVPLVGPFKLLYNLFAWFADGLINILDKQLTKSLEKWSENLDKMSAYEIYQFGTYNNNIPKKYKNKLDGDSDKIISIWAKQNFNLDWFKDEDRVIIKDELLKIREERAELDAQKRKLRREEEDRERLREEKRAELVAKINDKLSFIGKGWDSLMKGLNKMVDFDFTTMIKIAKKVVGILLTGIFLFASYFLVNCLVGVLITVGLFVGTNHVIILQILGSIVLLVIGVGVMYFVISKIIDKVDDIRKLYKNGDSVWYIQVLYLGIVRPLYYILYIPIYWLVMIPLNFIFNHFLWGVVCLRMFKPLGIWIWKGLVSFTGMFGEYFSASKGDYCPGVSWDDEK